MCRSDCKNMSTKKQLEEQLELQKEIIAKQDKLLGMKKSSPSSTKKVATKTSDLADGFHTVKRIESTTGGKALRIQKIVKDGEITGFYIANIAGKWDGRATGAHIPKAILEIAYEAMRTANPKELEA